MEGRVRDCCDEVGSYLSRIWAMGAEVIVRPLGWRMAALGWMASAVRVPTLVESSFRRDFFLYMQYNLSFSVMLRGGSSGDAGSTWMDLLASMILTLFPPTFGWRNTLALMVYSTEAIVGDMSSFSHSFPMLGGSRTC